MASFALMHPLGDQSFRLSSGYGYRTNPVDGEYKLHNGVDYAAGEGTEIYSPAAGTVSKIGSDSSSGNYLKIDHGNGYETAYAHMLSFSVQDGEKVRAGQAVGAVGTTGKSTGPHLHFVLRVNGSTTDPEPYITRSYTSYMVNYWWVGVIGLGGLWAAILARRRFRG